MTSEIIEAAAEYLIPRHLIWGVLIDPQMYPRLFRGVGDCAQIAVVDGRPVLDFLVGTPSIGTVTLRTRLTVGRRYESFDLQCPDSGGLVSVRVRGEGARTKVVVTVLGAGRVHPRLRGLGTAAVRTWIRDGLDRVAAFVRGEPASTVAGRGRAPRPRAMVARHVARSRPDIVLRQWAGLARRRFDATGFAPAAEHAPHRVAIADDWGSVTFGELRHRIQLLAGALAARGIGRGSAVGLLARNHIEAVQVVGAAAALGADLVFLNAGMSPEQVAGLAAPGRVAVLFVDGELEALTAAIDPSVPLCSTDGDSLFPSRPTVESLIRAGPRHRGRRRSHTGRIVLATSGAASAPRTVWTPQKRAVRGFADLLSRIPIGVDEAMLIAAPLSHAWGLAALRIAVLTRARLVLTDEFDAEDCLWLVATYRVRVLAVVPSMIRRLLELPVEALTRYDLSSLRVVASCGGPLPAELVRRFLDVFGDILFNVYGSAETSWISVAGPHDLRVSPGTVGRPPVGTEVAILGPELRPVPVGAVGRIFVRGRTVSGGYPDDPEPRTVAGMSDTGDVGYLDVAGRLFVAGRAADTVVTGGKRVLVRPVEEALESLPQVREVAVVGVPDRDRGHRLAAFVVPSEGSALDPDAVRGYVHARLGGLSVPQDVHFRTALPRSEIGTVLKCLLHGGPAVLPAGEVDGRAPDRW